MNEVRGGERGPASLVANRADSRSWPGPQRATALNWRHYLSVFESYCLQLVDGCGTLARDSGASGRGEVKAWALANYWERFDFQG